MGCYVLDDILLSNHCHGRRRACHSHHRRHRQVCCWKRDSNKYVYVRTSAFCSVLVDVVVSALRMLPVAAAYIIYLTIAIGTLFHRLWKLWTSTSPAACFLRCLWLKYPRPAASYCRDELLHFRLWLGTGMSTQNNTAGGHRQFRYNCSNILPIIMHHKDFPFLDLNSHRNYSSPSMMTIQQKTELRLIFHS